MRYWIDYTALKVVQLLMLVATTFAWTRTESFFTANAVVSAALPVSPDWWAWLRFVLAAGLVLGWVAVWKASRALQRQRERRFSKAEAEAIVRDAVADFRRRTSPGLDDPTREHEVVNADRASRQIHGLTAPQLAADALAIAHMERDLSCDADFRAIATRLNSEFPET